MGLDGKKRVSLAKALPALRSVVGDELEKVIFKVEVDDEGRIVLTPEVTIPAREAWLFKNPEALASVLRGLDDVKHGRVTRGESFLQYADDELE